MTTEGGQVIALDLRGTLADDGDLKYLAFLPWIKRLDVSETAIDNVGVSESVSSLTKLEWISFRQTRVTYNGIETILNVMPWVTIVDAQGFSGNAEARRHREQEAADALEVALEKFASSSRATGRKSLRKVIADYPNTKAAREAKVLLDGSRTPVNNR